MSSTSDDDEEYAFIGSQTLTSKRYPVHDCCEFEDAESLRRLIFVPEDDSNEEEKSHGEGNDDVSSSSDENDSTAAAHAAAIGHSPQPLAPSKSKLSLGASSSPVEEKPGDRMEITADEKDTPISSPVKTAVIDKSLAMDVEEPHFKEADKVVGHQVTSDMGSAGKREEGKPSGESSSKTETPPANGGAVKEEVNSGGNGEKTKKVKLAKPPRIKKRRFYCPHNLNERDGDENTPLHIAIHARKLEHVKLLLEAGASVHKKSDGSPPIHTAISMGSIPQNTIFSLECVKTIVAFDGDLTAKDDALHTPLYLACMFNLPQIASFILTHEAGKQTLNLRADRSGGRALHAAARYDRQSTGRAAAISSGARARTKPHYHHPDGTVANSLHHMPGFPAKDETAEADSKPSAGHSATKHADSLLTRTLLECEGIEVDAPNSVGQTPLHVACMRGNWPVVRLLLQAGASPLLADRRGFTPGQQAHKRGMPIPNDLLEVLGGPPETGTVAPPRDLIVDPDLMTLILCHELCILHRSCPPMRRDSQAEPPPENVRRLHVLIDEDTGILRSNEFSQCSWEGEARRAAIVDVLKVHEYNYVESISQMCSSIPDHPSAIAHLDADTAVSRWSFEAAMRASGSVCEAVDKVVSGDFRNAFCAVRPPGHHAGPRGIVRCANDPEGGSHGFCLLNNVAIGAAYARSMYRNEGIRKIAIIDFDVHHGNGTEEIIRNLVPGVEKSMVRTPFALGELSAPRYRPWLDETDLNDVFFASTHGYGPRGLEFADALQGGWFYPASGKTHTSDAILNPTMVESPGLSDFLLSQTWTRMGEDSRANCCKIMNCGLGLPDRNAVPGMQRLELRDSYRKQILPTLRDFDPDIIFISAGFDGHKKDTMNFGYVGMVEDDYEWVTEQLVKIANTCCNGRIVSVLEGGYKIHGGIVSPFARSVGSHVRALVDGGRSRELYDLQDGDWESQFERHLVEERERKRQQKLEKLRQIAEESRQALFASQAGMVGGTPEDPDAPSRKRRRNQVDYRELFEQMKREGFAG